MMFNDNNYQGLRHYVLSQVTKCIGENESKAAVCTYYFPDSILLTAATSTIFLQTCMILQIWRHQQSAGAIRFNKCCPVQKIAAETPSLWVKIIQFAYVCKSGSQFF